MYLAELHGKLSRKNENKEDILTSNVFSFFKYSDPVVFLLPLLQRLIPEIKAEDVKNAEFHFWPSFDDGTEPDLVILAGSFYLLIEAKFTSGFMPGNERLDHQLTREWSKGQNEAQKMGKIFKLITVTSHYTLSPCLKQEIQRSAPQEVFWINWQTICF